MSDSAVDNHASSLDRPGPIRGAALRRAMIFGTLGWMCGSVWYNSTSGTPLTNYANALGASRFQFGLLAALQFIASFLSLPASVIIEATGRRKTIFLVALYAQRLMWFPIALLPMWIVHRHGPESQGIAMAVFLWLVLFMHIGQAIGGPAWVAWMADLVPERARGRYFARRRAWGTLTAIPSAALVGWLLDRYGSGDRLMAWCAGIFIGAAIFGVLDIFAFEFVPDVPRKPQKGRHLLRAMRQPLHNREFLWFAGFVGTMFFAISFMGQFVTLYIMEQSETRQSQNLLTQMMVIVAPNVAMLLSLSAWGRAADRLGKKPLLILASLGLVPVALGWCLVTPGLVWLGYILSGAGGMLWAGCETANFNLVCEMSEDDKVGGSAYAAVNSMVINLAGCMGGLSAGIIAQWLKDWQWVTSYKVFTAFDILFVMSAGMRLLAVVVFLPHIHEPEARPTVEAFRFMTANIYNNLFAAVQQPLKVFGLTRRDEARLERQNVSTS